MPARRSSRPTTPATCLASKSMGATLGIIGMGNIGREVAQASAGFAMTVLYHNRRPRPDAEAGARASAT